MRLFVTRHGQTDWNLERRLQGWADNPINETGIRQAEELREKIKDIKFDVCYSSSLKRAAETAQILMGYKDPNAKPICPIRYDKRIRERGFGAIDSLEDSRVQDFVFHESWNLDLNSGKFGIEPIRTLYKRIYEFFHEEIPKIKAEFGDDATVLIVTHGGASRVLNYVILGGAEIPDKSSEAWKKTQEFILKNCDIVDYKV
ncbi:histidine phosphatase family protein [Candidatus Saccharibacteria bacterium]|nr:histidine phosphatase family protein [Candidatus Saccharibacteria bacterium]